MIGVWRRPEKKTKSSVKMFVESVSAYFIWLKSMIVDMFIFKEYICGIFSRGIISIYVRTMYVVHVWYPCERTEWKKKTNYVILKIVLHYPFRRVPLLFTFSFGSFLSVRYLFQCTIGKWNRLHKKIICFFSLFRIFPFYSFYFMFFIN